MSAIDKRDFYNSGGALPVEAPSYVARGGDGYLYTRLRLGEFCYVFGPRQTGKSSLMVRAAARLRSEGTGVALVGLAAVSRSQSDEQWYADLLARIGSQLGLQDGLSGFWADHPELPPAQRWGEALAQVAVARLRRVAIFLDEVDVTQGLPFSAELLFAGIRACLDRRREEPDLARLAFCVLGVARPVELSPNAARSPFEIGRGVELPDFTRAEADHLVQGLGKPGRGTSALLTRVLAWTGGHPYLTQRLCQELAASPGARRTRDVDALCRKLFLTPETVRSNDHLAFVWDCLEHGGPEPGKLRQLFEEIRSGRRVQYDPENPVDEALLLSGAVRVANGRLVVRNRIYAEALDPDLLASGARGHPRLKRPVRLTLVATASVGLLFLVDAGMRRIRPSGPASEQTGILQDGTRVKLELASFGKRHQLGSRIAWLRLPFMPLAPSEETTTSGDELMFFLTRRPGLGGHYLGFDWWGDAEAVDEHGCRFDVRERSQRVVGRGGNSGETQADGAPFSPAKPPYDFVLASGRMTVFPRRMESFRLELLNPDRSVACTLGIPNPVPGPYPTWSPEAYPIVRTIPGAEVVMPGAILHAYASEQSWLNLSGKQVRQMVQSDQFETDLTVRENGRPSPNWEAHIVDLSDATGNKAGTYNLNLCSREAAWKVRAQLFRKDTAQFSPAELWKLSGVPLHPPGKASALSGSTTVSGVTLRMLASAGAGTTRYTDGVPKALPLTAQQRKQLPAGGNSYSFTSDSTSLELSTQLPHLMLEHGPLKESQKLSVVGTDDRGRPFKIAGSNSISVSTRFFTLEVPPGARYLNFSVVVQTGKAVELLIRPPERWRLQPTTAGPGSGIPALAFSADGSTLLQAVSPAKQSGATTVSLTGTDKSAVTLAQTPRIHCVASAHGVVIAGGERGEVGFWSAASGERRALTTAHRGRVSHAVAAADSPTAVTAGQDGALHIWDLSRNSSKRSIPLGQQINALAISRDGGRAVVASKDWRLRLYSLTDGKLIKSWPSGDHEIKAVAFVPGTELLAEGDALGQVRTRHLRTLQVIREWREHFTAVFQVGVSTDGQRLVSLDEIGTVRVRDTRTGALIAVFSEGGSEHYATAAVSPAADRIVLGSAERDYIRHWERVGSR